MTSTRPAGTDPGAARTAAARAARDRTSQAALARVHDTIRQLRRDNARITVAAVARHAGVSRTFLYENQQAKAAIAAAIADNPASGCHRPGVGEGDHEASWRERALNAEDALSAAHAEITNQRERLGELLGHIRDLEADGTEDSLQRLTSENTTLKQRLRQLTSDHRTLEERLAAARATLHFQDRRIADLEAQLTAPAPSNDQHPTSCSAHRARSSGDDQPDNDREDPDTER